MILLDTCGILALTDGATALSAEARRRIGAAQGLIFVSAISAFELGQKHVAGKLVLPQPVDSWFPAIVRQHALREVGLDAAICAAATLLPPLHRDPFDRLLIATAHQHRLLILTSDKVISSYPGVRTLW